MIVFYGEGRLGNQVFQYQALSHVAKGGERVLAIGLEDLRRVFELLGPQVTVLTQSGLVKRLWKYLIIPLILRPMSRFLRLINYACEPMEGSPPGSGPSGVLSIRSGLLSRVTFVDGGHYQNASLWPAIWPAPLFRVRPELSAAASRYLNSISTDRCRPAFVHVRRGDYRHFVTYGLSDLSLPVRFYSDAIRELRKCIGDRHLVFVTDDPQWVDENFRDIGSKTVASFSAAMDFAIMTQCTSGILSNSTFSLAAAFMLGAPELLIAPRFWFGFRIQKWIPPRIEVQHGNMRYMSVILEPCQS